MVGWTAGLQAVETGEKINLTFGHFRVVCLVVVVVWNGGLGGRIRRLAPGFCHAGRISTVRPPFSDPLPHCESWPVGSVERASSPY